MRLLLTLGLLLSATMAVAEDDPYPHVQRYQSFVSELRLALERADPAAVALLTRFPLAVNLPGQTSLEIPNARTLQARFAEVFTPALRQSVQTAELEAPERLGGEQFLLANGLLWAEIVEHENGPRFRLAVVNVPGEAPEPSYPLLKMVCETPKHRIIIDQTGAEQSRYRSWNLPRALSDKPDLEMTGVSSSEGTGPCRHPVHTFERGDTRITVSEGGCRPDEWPENNVVVEVKGKLAGEWGCE